MTKEDILKKLYECVEGRSLYNGEDINFSYIAEFSEALLDENLESATTHMAMYDWYKFVCLKNSIWKLKSHLLEKENYYFDNIISEQCCMPYTLNAAKGVLEVDPDYFNPEVAHSAILGPSNNDDIANHEPLALVKDMAVGLFKSDDVNGYRLRRSDRLSLNDDELRNEARNELMTHDGNSFIPLFLISFLKNMEKMLERAYNMIERSYNETRKFAEYSPESDNLRFADIIDKIYELFHDNETKKFNIFEKDVTKGRLLLAMNIKAPMKAVRSGKQKAALAMVKRIRQNYSDPQGSDFLERWSKIVPSFLGIDESVADKHGALERLGPDWEDPLGLLQEHLVSISRVQHLETVRRIVKQTIKNNSKK